MSTEIYIADVSPLKDSVLYRRLYETVSKERRDKTDRYINQKNRNLSLAAAAVLRYALRERGIEKFTLFRGANGKPYIAEGNVFFSLSHSEERVMCAVSDMEVGCDTEKVKRSGDAIARRFFHPSECELLFKIEETEARTDMFYRLWTLKESYVKAIGTGMATPLKSFEVIPSEGAVTRADGTKYYFREYDRGDGYKYSVCGLSPQFNANMKVIDLDMFVQNNRI